MKSTFLRFRLPFGPLLLLAALLASLSVGYVGVRSLADSREAAVHLAETRSRNLANSADQNITSMLNRIDHTLLSVAGSMERNLGPRGLDAARMNKVLVLEEKYLPEAEAIRVTNSDGTVILSHTSDTPRTLADRPFFAYLKDHPEAGFSVTKPVQGLFTGKWAIPCARRYNLPDGRFGGIVVATVPLEHFEEQLGGYDVGPGGLRVLRDIDSGFIARYPTVVKGLTLPVGDTTISSELKALIRSGISQETYLAITPYDQTKRTVTFRRMKAAPFIVVAGLAEEDYLAQWYKDRARTLAVVAAFIAGAWIMAGLLWHLWKDRESDAEIIKKEKEKLRKYLDISAVIVVILDVNQQVILINKWGCEVLGYEEQEIVGRDWCVNFLPDRARSEAKNTFSKLMSGSVEPVEYYESVVLTKGGWERLIAWHTAVLRDEKNSITGILSSGGDITDEKIAFEKIEASLKEKELLLREIHHRVKNNMQVISSLLSLQTDQIKDSQYAEIFNDTITRVKTMSLVHEKLYMSEDLANIDFRDYIKDLSESLFSAYNTTAKNISLNIEAEGVLLNIDTAIPCGLVINELLSNSLKHAFPGGRKGEINVYLGKNLAEGKTVYDLVVSDNGIGIPDEINTRETASLGLPLVHTLVERQLRGTLDLDKKNGTKFNIRFREVSYGKRI